MGNSKFLHWKYSSEIGHKFERFHKMWIRVDIIRLLRLYRIPPLGVLCHSPNYPLLSVSIHAKPPRIFRGDEIKFRDPFQKGILEDKTCQSSNSVVRSLCTTLNWKTRTNIDCIYLFSFSAIFFLAILRDFSLSCRKTWRKEDMVVMWKYLLKI